MADQVTYLQPDLGTCLTHTLSNQVRLHTHTRTLWGGLRQHAMQVSTYNGAVLDT